VILIRIQKLRFCWLIFKKKTKDVLKKEKKDSQNAELAGKRQKVKEDGETVLNYWFVPERWYCAV